MSRVTMIAVALVATALSACNDKPPLDETSPDETEIQAVEPSGVEEWTPPSTEVPRHSLCMIDAVNGSAAVSNSARVASDKPLSLEGWVSTGELGNPGAFQVIFQGDSSYQVEAKTGISRPDVATAYSSPALAESGFTVDLPALGIPSGDYTMVLQHQGASSVVLCDTNIVLAVE